MTLPIQKDKTYKFNLIKMIKILQIKRNDLCNAELKKIEKMSN